MKIAVTYKNGQIFQHFGHTEQFKVYEVEKEQILSTEIIDTNGSGHGALASFLFNHQVEVLLCGGIGFGAQMALASAGIQLFAGIQGDADTAVQKFLSGTLSFEPNATCNHHHDHQEGEHACGEHHCGSHSCSDHEHNCHH